MYDLNKITEVSMKQINIVQMEDYESSNFEQLLKKAQKVVLCHICAYTCIFYVLILWETANISSFSSTEQLTLNPFYFKWSQEILKEQFKLILVLCQHSYS